MVAVCPSVGHRKSEAGVLRDIRLDTDFYVEHCPALTNARHARYCEIVSSFKYFGLVQRKLRSFTRHMAAKQDEGVSSSHTDRQNSQGKRAPAPLALSLSCVLRSTKEDLVALTTRR